MQTTSSTAPTTSTQTQTNCTPVPGTEQVNCNSRQIGGGSHTALTSAVEASDGNTYEVMCVPGAGGRFLAGASQGMAAQSGAPTHSGCQVQPGTYQARWDKGRLKVLLHNPKGKEKEVTFAVLASAQTVTGTINPTPRQSNSAAYSALQTVSAEGNYIGTTKLEIGMPRRVVEAELAKRYRVTPNAPNGDSVHDGDSDMGMVIFDGDRLSVIVSVLYSKAVGDKEFANVLYSSVSSFIHDENNCSIHSIPFRVQENVQAEGLVFVCGDRKMRLMIVTDPAGTKTLTLSEAVGEKP